MGFLSLSCGTFLPFLHIVCSVIILFRSGHFVSMDDDKKGLVLAAVLVDHHCSRCCDVFLYCYG